MKRTVPAGHKPSWAAVTLTSLFLAAATLSGCGGGDSASSAPSSGDPATGNAPAPAPLLDGTTADPNPPVQETDNAAPAPAPALPTPVTDAPAQPPLSQQVTSGVDMSKLIDAGRFISEFLGRPSGSRAARAIAAKAA